MKQFIFLFLLLPVFTLAQKKPLDHTVYDGWQRISDRVISNDGHWVAYTISPQEGDDTLVVLNAGSVENKIGIPRGTSPVITADSRYLVFKINPFFKDIRQAKIKKKKPDEMPLDSLGILELSKSDIVKIAQLKSFKTPEKGAGWIAYIREVKTKQKKDEVSGKALDSLKKKIDSLTILVTELKNMKTENNDSDLSFAPGDEKKDDNNKELVIRNLNSGKEYVFKFADEYIFDKKGNYLAFNTLKNPKDSNATQKVLLFDTRKAQVDTILQGGNDFKGFTFSEDGDMLTFLAERGADKKALQKFYELFLYKNGRDSAVKVIDTATTGMPVNSDVSEYSNLRFSKSGNRLFFGTAEIRPPKDTTLVDIDLVKLDIWNYKDDYLQPQQLSRLQSDLKRNYLAVLDLNNQKMTQLGSEALPIVMPTNEGDGGYFIAITDTGRRVASQWSGRPPRDVYWMDVKSGAIHLIKKNLDGNVYESSTGKYVLLYDSKFKNYFAWNGKQLKNISTAIKVPLYDEENDVPDEPNTYGIMGWTKDDQAVLVYDRYDVWKLDPEGKQPPIRITPDGRSRKVTYRYLRTDREEQYLTPGQEVYFSVFNNVNKDAGIAKAALSDKMQPQRVSYGSFDFSNPVKAKDADAIIYTKESYVLSPDLYLKKQNSGEEKISSINQQQSEYNWGTATLYHWKAFDGAPGTGILYKPENFDSTKKYPIIFYFYEKLSDGLNKYIPPSPTPSRLNISFFVSRGYLVFAPDISYKIGHPGKSAYNYIVSAAKDLAKHSWVDGKNMGIQGQSWGGYQVAYLITATPMFKAAWSGAPVVNMFSAYGGIRWQSGMNRQFQYEKTQSRIGATIWERPDLYIENSPLFHLQRVKTPVVIMSNDADGAVPWYQGIEMFTALRRLGKPAWLLNYNGEAHNLVERKNKKDISIREQQFFDWLLKGDKAPRWIKEGVPAVDKGRDWGLEY